MTVAGAPTGPPRNGHPAVGRHSTTAARDSTGHGTPVIVLTYLQSGSGRLRDLLPGIPA